MSWPADLEPYGTVDTVRQHYGVSDALWASFTEALGDMGNDLRLLANLPKATVAHGILAARDRDGRALTAVQGTQLGLCYRLASRSCTP